MGGARSWGRIIILSSEPTLLFAAPSFVFMRLYVLMILVNCHFVRAVQRFVSVRGKGPFFRLYFVVCFLQLRDRCKVVVLIFLLYKVFGRSAAFASGLEYHVSVTFRARDSNSDVKDAQVRTGLFCSVLGGRFKVGCAVFGLVSGGLARAGARYLYGDYGRVVHREAEEHSTFRDSHGELNFQYPGGSECTTGPVFFDGGRNVDA